MFPLHQSPPPTLSPVIPPCSPTILEACHRISFLHPLQGLLVYSSPTPLTPFHIGDTHFRPQRNPKPGLGPTSSVSVDIWYSDHTYKPSAEMLIALALLLAERVSAMPRIPLQEGALKTLCPYSYMKDVMDIRVPRVIHKVECLGKDTPGEVGVIFGLFPKYTSTT